MTSRKASKLDRTGLYVSVLCTSVLVLSGGRDNAMAAMDAVDKPADVSQTSLPEPVPPTLMPVHKKREIPDFSSAAYDHKPVTIGPILSSTLIKVGTMDPIKFDASYSEPISLRQALIYAVANNLSIKVSKESLIYQRFQFYSNVGSFLPTNAMNWNLVRSDVQPNTVVSRSRVFTESVRFPVFQGGSIFYTALAQYYRQAGWAKAYQSTLQDTLLNVYQNYANAQLNRALLQIRALSVEVSDAELRFNEKLYLAGKGTRFAIMQSKAQLESDRLDLLDQQVALRNAALNLAFSLNAPMSVNLIPVEDTISENSLVNFKEATPESLIKIAIEHRPDLRQYELFRIAAQRTVQQSAAPLYPSMTLFPSYTRSSTSVSGENSGNVAGAGVFGGLFETVQQGMVSGLTTSGLGVTASMNICAANALARQAQLQANQQLLSATRQIRVDYLRNMTAQTRISAATAEVLAAKEALRLAQARLKAGLTTNLDVIQSQRDFVSASIKRVRAIFDSNQAQAQLLHDLGTISVDSLTATNPR